MQINKNLRENFCVLISCPQKRNFLLFIVIAEGGDYLNDNVIVAVLSLIGTLGGTLGGILATSRLSNYRIEQLEKKVEKHNSLIERTFRLEETNSVLEEKIRVANHRIDDLEDIVN